jgi:hypothetical protein
MYTVDGKAGGDGVNCVDVVGRDCEGGCGPGNGEDLRLLRPH